MNRIIILSFTLLAIIFIIGCEPEENNNNDLDSGTDIVSDAGVTCEALSIPDDDNDGISNSIEGNGTVDTDEDGKPDTRDTDSDNDGIPDSEESGRDACQEQPIDSDQDSIPDYLDTDSDKNGLPDKYELNRTQDTDGDNIPDWRDVDDDNDGIIDSIEMGPDPLDPADTNGNGIPDYHDVDSDSDTILDKNEGTGDPDQDGLPNYKDTDSDGDGLLDIDEAGDTDVSTLPVNSDDDPENPGCGTGDIYPDFIDTDSDNDGLYDWEENETYHTSPTDIDTDGDNYTDLAEVAVGSDALDANSKIEGFYIELPYDDPEDSEDDYQPIVKELQFTTDIQIADVYFMLDTTGSMSEEIGIITQSIANTIAPGLQKAIPDIALGVGEFRDDCDGDYFPVRNRINVTTNITEVQNTLSHITDGGGCGYTTIVEGLYRVITGQGESWNVSGGCGGSYGVQGSSCLTGGYGLPCFRDGALPIFIGFSDAEARCDSCQQQYSCTFDPTVKGYSEVITTLIDSGARFIGVNSGGNGPNEDAGPDFRMLAQDTGTIRDDGTPVVFDIQADGEGIDERIVDAVGDLAQFVRMDVDTIKEERPYRDDGIDATKFINYIKPLSYLNENHENPIERMDEETFYGVLPGTFLTFEVSFYNDFVPEREFMRAFRSRIIVRGNGVTQLDTNEVLIIVPGNVGCIIPE